MVPQEAVDDPYEYGERQCGAMVLLAPDMVPDPQQQPVGQLPAVLLRTILDQSSNLGHVHNGAGLLGEDKVNEIDPYLSVAQVHDNVIEIDDRVREARGMYLLQRYRHLTQHLQLLDLGQLPVPQQGQEGLTGTLGGVDQIISVVQTHPGYLLHTAHLAQSLKC